MKIKSMLVHCELGLFDLYVLSGSLPPQTRESGFGEV